MRSQGNATVSDIHFENIAMDGVGVGINVDMTYETPGSTVKNIGCVATGVTFTNISGTAKSPGSLECLKTRPCEQFAMDNVDVKYDGGDHKPWKCGNVAVSKAGPVEPALPSSCEGHL